VKEGGDDLCNRGGADEEHEQVEVGVDAEGIWESRRPFLPENMTLHLAFCNYYSAWYEPCHFFLNTSSYVDTVANHSCYFRFLLE
jgi:hypothetical protein